MVDRLTPILARSTNVKRLPILAGAVTGPVLLAGCGGGRENPAAPAALRRR